MYSGQFAKLKWWWSFCLAHHCFVPSPAFGSLPPVAARLLARLYAPTSGGIRLFGATVGRRRWRSSRRYASQVQMILQDPRQFADKYPHELSGGQRQRAAIARALAARPAILLADEPVSMLDVSIRLGVLKLLGRLASSRKLATLYITHDIASARFFATTTIVMYAGRLVEGGPSELVTQQPAHPYSQLLLASAPDPDKLGSRSVALTTGEPPSLIAPPAGCRFHPRCPHAMPVCSTEAPPRTELAGGQWVHCWLHGTDA